MKTPYETPEAELIRIALEKNILSVVNNANENVGEEDGDILP